ncbi:MAG: hypothetical protein OHK0038_07260 [Flammeovirgaceae bacterium]
MTNFIKIVLHSTAYEFFSILFFEKIRSFSLLIKFVFFVLLNSQLAHAQNNQWQYIGDHTRDWKVYDGKSNSFLPYIPEFHRDKKCIYLKISKEESYKNAFLLIKNLQNKSLFVNQSLAKISNPESEYFLKLTGEDITLAVISEDKIDSPIEVKIALHSDKSINKYMNYNSLSLSKRSDTGEFLQQRFLLIGISSVILIICLSMLTELRFALASTFNLLGARIFFKDSETQEKLSGQDYIAFVICYALTLTYFYLLLGNYINDNQWINIDNQTLILQWGDFFSVFLFFIVVVIVKFLWIWILANLHNIRNLASEHHYEFIQTSFTLSVIFMVIGVWYALSGGYNSPESFSKILVTILLIKSLIICWKVQQQQSLKKIYLFSYFCGTEILPILISAKFLIKV